MFPEYWQDVEQNIANMRSTFITYNVNPISEEFTKLKAPFASAKLRIAKVQRLQNET